MLGTSCIQIIKKQVSLYSYLFTLPYEWDDKSRRIKLITSIRRNKLRFKCLTFVWVYLGALMLNSIRSLGLKNNNSAFLTALGVMWTTIIFGSFYSLVICRKLEAEFLSLFNCLLGLPLFNDREGQKVTKMILSFGLMLSIMIGPFVACLLWIIPCIPPFLGSMIIECNSDGFAIHPLGIIGASVVVIQAILNFLVWSFVFPWCVFYGFDVFPMAVVSFTSYMETINKSRPMSSYVKTHARIYRKAQVLTVKLNECFQYDLLPTEVSVAGIVEIVCLYVSIAKRKNIPTAAFLFFPLVTADTTIILFGMLGLASKVLTTSQQTLIKMQQCSINVPAAKKRWFKRFLRSCPPQKVGFGSCNFIDQTTPLVIIQYCISQLVSLIFLDR